MRELASGDLPVAVPTHLSDIAIHVAEFGDDTVNFAAHDSKGDPSFARDPHAGQQDGRLHAGHQDLSGRD